MTQTHHQILRQQLVHLINRQKNIAPSDLLGKNFEEVGFDMVDLVDIILEVEKVYHITIPDELPLHRIDDFVYFIAK